MNTSGIISGQQEVLIDEGGNTCGSGFALVKDNNPSKINPYWKGKLLSNEHKMKISKVQLENSL
jgi:hypothetical protein